MEKNSEIAEEMRKNLGNCLNRIQTFDFFCKGCSKKKVINFFLLFIINIFLLTTDYLKMFHLQCFFRLRRRLFQEVITLIRFDEFFFII